MLRNILVLFMLSLMPINAICANLIYRENFDDQSVAAPPFGSIAINENLNPAYYPADYFWATGRGGSGYAFSGQQNRAAWLQWTMNRTWPTDEMYVSFWFRYANFTSTDSHENIKMFYPHYGTGGAGYTTCTLSTPDWNHGTIKSDSGSYIEPGQKIDLNFKGQTNGQWHHFEYWIKFSTAQIKYWYDGVLKAERNYADTTDGVDTWSGYIMYTTLGHMDSEEQGSFMRQFDDWEVWDGIPSSKSFASKPSAPSALKID